MHELITWLGKGFYFFLFFFFFFYFPWFDFLCDSVKGIMLFNKGDLPSAAHQFNYVLAQDSKNVPAIVGKVKNNK